MNQGSLVVTGGLAWYDEPVDELERCVRSCSVLLDRLVAVDGGYRLVDDARPVSPAEQARAIKRAAADVGLAVDVLAPDRLWAGQVEKRDQMMRLACRGATFVMPIDSDWQLHGDRAAVRAELARVATETDADSIVVPFATPVPDGVDIARAAAHEWHVDLAGKTVPIELIFRALPGFRVERHHWFYSAVRDGRRIALWGCQGMYPAARRHRLEADFRIDHLCFFRDQERIDRNRLYSARRDIQAATTGAEA